MHFEEKEALKNTFPQQKNTTMKKKHFCFLKTLAGRTAVYIHNFVIICELKILEEFCKSMGSYANPGESIKRTNKSMYILNKFIKCKLILNLNNEMNPFILEL